MKRLFLSFLITLLVLCSLLPGEGRAVQQCSVEFPITGTGTVTARDPNMASKGAKNAAQQDYDQKVAAYQCPEECPVLTRVALDSGGQCWTLNGMPPTTCTGWVKGTFTCQPQAAQ